MEKLKIHFCEAITKLLEVNNLFLRKIQLPFQVVGSIYNKANVAGSQKGQRLITLLQLKIIVVIKQQIITQKKVKKKTIIKQKGKSNWFLDQIMEKETDYLTK